MPRTILVAWTFYTAFGTESATEASRLMTDSESGVHGAATVRWDTDASMPSVSHPAARDGQVDAFWGLLFGLSLYGPLLSAAMCSPARTTTHGLVAVGISREFMNKLRDRITPYTHNVFIVAPHDAAERLKDEVAPLRPDEILFTVMDFGEAFSVEDMFDSAPNQSTPAGQPSYLCREEHGDQRHRLRGMTHCLTGEPESRGLTIASNVNQCRQLRER